jgi:hypothetical protein
LPNGSGGGGDDDDGDGWDSESRPGPLSTSNEAASLSPHPPGCRGHWQWLGVCDGIGPHDSDGLGRTRNDSDGPGLGRTQDGLGRTRKDYMNMTRTYSDGLQLLIRIRMVSGGIGWTRKDSDGFCLHDSEGLGQARPTKPRMSDMTQTDSDGLGIGCTRPDSDEIGWARMDHAARRCPLAPSARAREAPSR